MRFGGTCNGQELWYGVIIYIGGYIYQDDLIFGVGRKNNLDIKEVEESIDIVVAEMNSRFVNAKYNACHMIKPRGPQGYNVLWTWPCPNPSLSPSIRRKPPNPQTKQQDSSHLSPAESAH